MPSPIVAELRQLIRTTPTATLQREVSYMRHQNANWPWIGWHNGSAAQAVSTLAVWRAELARRAA